MQDVPALLRERLEPSYEKPAERGRLPTCQLVYWAPGCSERDRRSKGQAVRLGPWSGRRGNVAGMATLTPRPIEFADAAPVHAEGTAVVDGTPMEVWAVLTDNERWPEWFAGVTSCRTTSDPSIGLGSTREVLLGKGRPLRFVETFIAWDEGERWAFTATDAPGVLAGLVERCLITPISPTRTRVTYRMAYDPRPALKPFLPVVRPAVSRALTKGMQGLARQVQAHRPA